MPQSDERKESPECFECGYSLLGLTENRCPECGLDFNPNNFLPIDRQDLWHSNPWEVAPGLNSFVATLALSLFRPSRLFAGYSGHYDETRSITFFCLCYAIGAVELVAAYLTDGLDSAPAGIVAAIVTSLGAGLVHPLVRQTLVRSLVTPTDRAAELYWKPHSRYLSGFFMLTSANACWAVIDFRNTSGTQIVPIQAALINWWLVSLVKATVSERRQTGARLDAAIALLCVCVSLLAVGYWFVVAIALRVMNC